MISETKRAYLKKYQAEHRDQLRAYFRARYQSNREVYIAQGRKRYSDNKTEMLGQQKLRYQEHRLEILAKQKIYSKAHSKAISQKASKWAAAHPERRREILRRYYQRHKLEESVRSKAHRARRAGATVNVEELHLVKAFYASIRSHPFVKCYWCGAKVSGSDIHVDHVIAVAKGGNHAIENLAASCAPCNRSKSAKLPHEWTKHPQMFFTL